MRPKTFVVDLFCGAGGVLVARTREAESIYAAAMRILDARRLEKLWADRDVEVCGI